MNTLSKLKNVLLIVLLTLLVGYFIYTRVTRVPEVDLTEYVKIGSKEYIKLSSQRDTVYVDTVIYREKYIPKVITKTKVVELPLNVDTTAILKDYYTTRYYEDIISDGLEDGNNVVVKDSISENRIISRETEFNVKTKIVHETVIAVEPPRTKVFIGPGVDFGKNAFGLNTSLLIKTKKDKVYQLQGGLQNLPGSNEVKPYYGVGVHWKIGLRRKK